MNRTLAGILVVLSTGVTGMAGPRDEVLAAMRDAQSLSPEQREQTRYLTTFNLEETERKLHYLAQSFWGNSLSREAVITRPRQVTPTLLAIELDHYGWDHGTWEKLAQVDPYFHVTATLTKTIKQPYGYYRVPGDESSFVQTEVKEIKKTVTERIHAPWVPEAGQLGEMLNTTAPILFADWWLHQVSAQEDRGGSGYYDFLGITNRDDIDELVGLDRETAVRVKREIMAIMKDSGVARGGRQIVRLGAVTGGTWFTLDTAGKPIGERNHIRNLDKDYIHDAEEIYAVLPNGLFLYAASDAKGNLQDKVPPEIAQDRSSPSNDLNIHPGISCVRCHKEGLRPIDDYARRTYRKTEVLERSLSSPDREKLKRLKQLYLDPLDRWVDEDREDFAYAIKRVNGLTIEENALIVGEVWEQYESPKSLADVARRAGVTPQELQIAISAYAQLTIADPVITGLVADPPESMRYEHLEEAWPLIMGLLNDEHE